jgi:hypothetical protein
MKPTLPGLSRLMKVTIRRTLTAERAASRASSQWRSIEKSIRVQESRVSGLSTLRASAHFGGNPGALQRLSRESQKTAIRMASLRQALVAANTEREESLGRALLARTQSERATGLYQQLLRTVKECHEEGVSIDTYNSCSQSIKSDTFHGGDIDFLSRIRDESTECSKIPGVIPCNPSEYRHVSELSLHNPLSSSSGLCLHLSRADKLPSVTLGVGPDQREVITVSKDSQSKVHIEVLTPHDQSYCEGAQRICRDLQSAQLAGLTVATLHYNPTSPPHATQYGASSHDDSRYAASSFQEREFSGGRGGRK